MKLQELGSQLVLSRIEGNSATEISGLQIDSRKVKPGDLFICLAGQKLDGHDFADEAIKLGAAALVVQRKLEIDVPMLIIPDSRYALAVIANHYYRYPSLEMKVIGVTGTNGKTTMTYLIERILSDYNKKTGLMGTIQMKIGDLFYEVKNTTQGALDLQQNFRKMRDINTEYCIMEVSSHALQLGRVKGSMFRTAVFTNLTQDHLDYHKSMLQYREAKGLMFSRLGNAFHPKKQQYAILNTDDPASEYFQHSTAAQVVSYGIDHQADVRATEIKMSSAGTEFRVSTFVGDMVIKLQLMGKFSVYNALGAIAATLVEGIPLQNIKNSLALIKGVDGRFESIHEGQPYSVIVDYAHTPDSLENVLTTIKEFAERQIICVFGCGGDRDRSKRSMMGAIAAKYSDYIVVTSDNPRSEDPFTIIKDIEEGILDEGFNEDQYELVIDRKSAIEIAIEKASLKDVILIAGKGHETYQEIKGKRIDFDDRIIAKKAIRSLQSD